METFWENLYDAAMIAVKVFVVVVIVQLICTYMGYNLQIPLIAPFFESILSTLGLL